MIQIRTSDQLELQIDYSAAINYIAALRGEKTIKALSLKNIGEFSISDVIIKITGHYFPKFEFFVDKIESGETRDIEVSEVAPKSEDIFFGNSEAGYTEFELEIKYNEDETVSFRFPLNIQAWNYWRADISTYEEIASFVIPDEDYISEIIKRATAILQRRSQSRYSQFGGYDSSDPNFTLEQVVAICSAVGMENLKCRSINISHMKEGCRVNTPGFICHAHSGTDLEVSLLLCSCLEHIGLSSCLVFLPEQVVTGVWLDSDHHFASPVVKDQDKISRYMTNEKSALMLIDPIVLCSETSKGDGVISADMLAEKGPVVSIVDIANSRKEGIHPIQVPSSVIGFQEKFDIKRCSHLHVESSRVLGWERKLLDMSLRNSMINLKPGKSIVPICEDDVTKVVEHLKKNTLSELVVDSVSVKSKIDPLKYLYRMGRTLLEENGANSLFVSLGCLRWFDIDDSRPHLAPLLFVPVSIVRKKAMKFEIRLRDDEPMLNVTLIEMLRQMFEISFPELETLPERDDGFTDWEKIFDIFAGHIMDINKQQQPGQQWELLNKSYIGIFSFSKFLMWHDIHHHPEAIFRNDVLRGLIERHYEQKSPERSTDAANVEAYPPGEYMIPIDYDSSQLKAVAESHEGQSFVLHGPPGTGKSQTITNLIADAIYSGKRVLFVAEKKAALEVVRKRLNSIGLEPYCLELHSNKTDKKSFFSQLQVSNIRDIGAGIGRRMWMDYGWMRDHEWKNVIGAKKEADEPSEIFTTTAQILSSAQQQLREITDAIHTSGVHGLSLYDCVNRLLETEYTDFALSYSDVKDLTPTQVEHLIVEFVSLDLVAEIIGYHPSLSPLIGFYPNENTSENQIEVTDSLTQMPARIARARKKAQSILNRWFSKKTPEEILSKDKVWQQLQNVASIDPEKCETIDEFEKNITRWIDAIEGLRDWYAFVEKVNEIAKYNLPKSMEYYLQGKKGKETGNAVENGYYRALAYHVIDNDQRLRKFYGMLHENSVDKYRSYAKKFQTACREELLRKLHEKISMVRLNDAQETELSLLKRRIHSNGWGIALRKIIAEAKDILNILFPCMLMSPLSVAQYIDMDSDLFDLVIFDEASQMETPDAIGSIARGRSLIVVGDPLQLPPTRFFTSQNSAGEEMEVSEDSDSILEDCIALGLPSHYLSRHYRSRHESLIAFSNNHFYENRLLTFPSHNDSERKVSFIDSHGVYDYGKTRTNSIEAEAVVDYIIGLVEKSKKAPSIGVVAFSKPQSNLIEDILNAKLVSKKEVNRKLDDAEESLFIKNLENVQGDERDIIIFSIGYGPNKFGNVSLNLGPLNRIGGERRLNVAVSRAREEMVVFSSLHPQHIPAEGIQSKGLTALRNFLEYAIHGHQDQPGSTESERETIVEDIAEKLRSRGLNVVTKVGRSSFKIDVAVIDEKNPENYRLGIIVDGAGYNSLPTIRDREITVPSVLNSLGWKLVRIWTLEWLKRPDAVLTHLSDALAP